MRHLFKFAFLIFSVIFTIQCALTIVPSIKSQERVRRTVVATEADQPSDEADIDGKLTKTNIPNLEMETFISQPAPEVWLVFSCQKKVEEKCPENSYTLELNDEAKNLIKDYWRKALTFSYKSVLKRKEFVTDGNVGIKLDTEHFNNSQKFAENIKKLSIDAPNGKRFIANKEAWKLVGFINKSAAEVTEQSENN